MASVSSFFRGDGLVCHSESISPTACTVSRDSSEKLAMFRASDLRKVDECFATQLVGLRSRQKEGRNVVCSNS